MYVHKLLYNRSKVTMNKNILCFFNKTLLIALPNWTTVVLVINKIAKVLKIVDTIPTMK